jgi:hypothetical protein
MLTGQISYPDEYSADLTLGHNLLLFQDMGQKKKGTALVEKAFRLNPSPSPMLDLLLIAGRYKELQPQVDALCTEYTKDFEENKATYATQDGYNLKLEAARLALVRLEQAAKLRGDAKQADAYRNQWTQYERERNLISLTKRW